MFTNLSQQNFQNTNLATDQQSYYLSKGVHAFHDLMDVMQNLDPYHQQLLTQMCALELLNQMEKNYVKR